MDELENALDVPRPVPDSRPGESDQSQKQYGDPVVQGPLLTKQGPDLAKHLHGLWKAQNQHYERPLIQWRINERRRAGENGLFITKRENLGQLEVYIPPGGKAPNPVYNKADRLCHRSTAFQFADDYQPYVEPSEDTDEDRDSAEIAQRALEDVSAATHLNLGELIRQAFDRAHTSGSGYIVLYADPYAGGRHPMQIEAGEGAVSVEDATEDPMTGQPRPNLTLKYVREDGSLSDTPQGAALQWRPELDGCVYAARHVRFAPWDSADIWDADGVLIAEYRPFGQLKRLYKDLAELDEDEVRALAEHRPEGWREMLPWRDGKPFDPGQPEETPVDDLLVPHLRYWGTECGEYPDGVYVSVVGKDTIVSQETWIGEDEKGRFKIELPVIQVKQWRKASNPHGDGTMDILGDASESRAAIMAMLYDYCEKVENRKVFVPSNSTLSGQDFDNMGQTYIPINGGGQPIYEEIPPLPKEITETFMQLTAEMDDAVSLSQTAQNLDTNPNQSGRAKLAIISQVQASLSDQKRFVQGAFQRAWTVCLQLMRKYYTKPQQLQWAGEHGGYKFKRWQGSDLSGVRDVKVRPGTGTMLTPMQKIEQALMLQQSGVVQLPEVLDTLGHDVGAITGIQDNVHLQRVRRQIAEWDQGPPEGSEPIPEQPQMQPVVDPMTGQPALDPMGQPVQQPVMGPQGPVMFQPVNPQAALIFKPILADSQMDVAPIRARELGKAMAGVRYLNFPPDWQEALNQAYSQSVMAMQPPPPPGNAPEPEDEDESPELTDGELAMAGKSPDSGQNA